MEKNCLAKSLMVDGNNNLEYMGYVKARVSMSSGMTLRFCAKSTLILLDGKWVSNNSDKLVVEAETNVYPGNSTINPNTQGASYVSILIPKYTCYYYGGVFPASDDAVVDMSGFRFGSADDATDIMINSPGNVKSKGCQDAPLNKARIFQFNGGSDVVGEPINLTQLGADGLLTTFRALGLVNAEGTLDNLGKSNVTWNSGAIFPNNKNVSIDIVNFVNNNRNAGRTTGSVDLRNVGRCTVKANGVTLDIPDENSNVLVWTADSITFKGNPIS